MSSNNPCSLLWRAYCILMGSRTKLLSSNVKKRSKVIYVAKGQRSTKFCLLYWEGKIASFIYAKLECIMAQRKRKNSLPTCRHSEMQQLEMGKKNPSLYWKTLEVGTANNKLVIRRTDRSLCFMLSSFAVVKNAAPRGRETTLHIAFTLSDRPGGPRGTVFSGTHGITAWQIKTI